MSIERQKTIETIQRTKPIIKQVLDAPKEIYETLTDEEKIYNELKLQLEEVKKDFDVQKYFDLRDAFNRVKKPGFYLNDFELELNELEEQVLSHNIKEVLLDPIKKIKKIFVK